MTGASLPIRAVPPTHSQGSEACRRRSDPRTVAGEAELRSPASYPAVAARCRVERTLAGGDELAFGRPRLPSGAEPGELIADAILCPAPRPRPHVPRTHFDAESLGPVGRALMRVDGRQHAAQPDRIERISRRPPAAITDQLSEARLDDFGGPGTPGARQQSRARQSELSGPSVRAASAVDGVAEGFVAVSFELLARWPLRFGRRGRTGGRCGCGRRSRSGRGLVGVRRRTHRAAGPSDGRLPDA